MIIAALQLQLAVLLTKIQALKAQLSPEQAQTIDWTPLDIATRQIPETANELP